MTWDDAQEVLRALVGAGVDFVVVGSMAMAAQGLPRATHDLDLFVSPHLDNLRALKGALRRHFNDLNVDDIDVDELAGDYPAVEYTPPHGRFSLDLLTRLGQAFSWSDLHTGSEEIDFGDLTIRVATPETLYRMKKDTVRPQDRADAARIREAFGIGEEG